MARKSRRDHSGSAGSGDPAVEYGYEISGADNAKNFRANSVTYPNARVVKYDYGSGSNDALNRVHQIENSESGHEALRPASGEAAGPPPTAVQGRSAFPRMRCVIRG